MIDLWILNNGENGKYCPVKRQMQLLNRKFSQQTGKLQSPHCLIWVVIHHLLPESNPTADGLGAFSVQRVAGREPATGSWRHNASQEGKAENITFGLPPSNLLLAEKITATENKKKRIKSQILRAWANKVLLLSVTHNFSSAFVQQEQNFQLSLTISFRNKLLNDRPLHKTDLDPRVTHLQRQDLKPIS